MHRCTRGKLSVLAAGTDFGASAKPTMSFDAVRLGSGRHQVATGHLLEEFAAGHLLEEFAASTMRAAWI